ncbi:MAG: hypothetical protein ACI3ZO_09855 [Candidatus Cryptobacteroides sp.]|nr:hypothetical protein [Bacteroidales bacterium]
MAEFDSSVELKTVDSLIVTSELVPEDFEKAVFDSVSAGRTISGLGCGRVLVDWSVFTRTRYILCDIYEEESSGSPEKTYRIDVKAGEKNSFGGDIVYCILFLLGFWLLRCYFKNFGILYLALVAVDAVAAIWLAIAPRRAGFGHREAASVVSDLKAKLPEKSCTIKF